jgi:hypothetical protein
MAMAALFLSERPMRAAAALQRHPDATPHDRLRLARRAQLKTG